MQPSKETSSCSLSSFLTFYSVLLSISMPSSIWKLAQFYLQPDTSEMVFHAWAKCTAPQPRLDARGRLWGWKRQQTFKVRNWGDLLPPKCNLWFVSLSVVIRTAFELIIFMVRLGKTQGGIWGWCEGGWAGKPVLALGGKKAEAPLPQTVIQWHKAQDPGI